MEIIQGSCRSAIHTGKLIFQNGHFGNNDFDQPPNLDALAAIAMLFGDLFRNKLELVEPGLTRGSDDMVNQVAGSTNRNDHAK